MNQQQLTPQQTECKSNRRVSRRTYASGIAAALISSYFILLTAIPAIIYYSQPLENALVKGDIEGVKKAIAEGANVNAVSFSSVPIILRACDYGRYDKRLLAKPELRLQKLREMLEMLIDNGADVNTQDRSGRTALFRLTSNPWVPYRMSTAAVEEYKILLAMLISKGADVNVKDHDDWTPLHNTIFLAALSDSSEIVELLLESGADPNIKNKYGETPLGLATRKKDKKIAQLLRKYGAGE